MDGLCILVYISYFDGLWHIGYFFAGLHFAEGVKLYRKKGLDKEKFAPLCLTLCLNLKKLKKGIDFIEIVRYNR